MAFENVVKIGDVKKNNRGEVIRISTADEKSGGKSIDVRQYYTDDAGELMPTKKGVRINSEIAPEVVYMMFKGLDDAAKEDFINLLGLSVPDDSDYDDFGDEDDIEDDEDIEE